MHLKEQYLVEQEGQVHVSCFCLAVSILRNVIPFLDTMLLTWSHNKYINPFSPLQDILIEIHTDENPWLALKHNSGDKKYISNSTCIFPTLVLGTHERSNSEAVSQ